MNCSPNRFEFCFFLICISLFSSCGYHWRSESFSSYRPSIAVPFIEGDVDGSLTQSLVYALSSSGKLDVRQREAQYRLQASIIQASTETIGYRRDRQKISGEIKKNLVSSENRKTLVVEISLYQGSGERLICGPIRLEADADYDYIDGDSMQDLAFINPLGQQQTVLPFSLGQLEPKEAAEEAATRPLNIRMAKQIVEAVVHLCFEGEQDSALHPPKD